MNSQEYVCIFHKNTGSLAGKLRLNLIIFEQYNALKHRSKLAKNYFFRKKHYFVKVTSTKPRYDLIETLRAHIKEKLVDFMPKNKEEFKAKILEIWNEISS
jgi:hypothetical protein